MFKTPIRKKYKLLYFYIFICLYFYIPDTIATESCTTIPISLSNIRSCEDNICYLSTQATISLSLGSAPPACLEFVPPDGLSSSSNLVVMVQSAFYRWNVDYVYFTDSPALIEKSNCHCFGQPGLHCPNCDFSFPNGSVVLCKSGVLDDPGCLMDGPFAPFGLHKKGTWCYKAGLTGLNRFKVIKILPSINKEIVIDLAYSSSNNISTTHAVVYNGDTIGYDDADHDFNITIVSDTAAPSLIPDFVVYDVANPSDFYLLDAADVNAKFDYNLNKLGWFKSDQTEKAKAVEISNNINIRSMGCHTSKNLMAQHTWVDPIDVLNNRRNRLSNAIIPGSFLIDPDYEINPTDRYKIPNHAISPYNYLQNGLILADPDGSPIFIGKTEKNILVPTSGGSTLSSGRYIDNHGQIVTVTPSESVTAFVFAFKTKNPSTGDFLVKTMFIIQSNTDDDQWGIAHSASYYNQTGIIWAQTPFTFTALNWPDLRLYFNSFDGTFHSLPVPNSQTHLEAPALLTKALTGAIEITIAFKNLEIQFESTVIRPRINTIESLPELLKVNAQSVTVGGQCYIASNPAGLFVTQPITLSLAPTDYEYEWSQTVSEGDYEIVIRCFKNVAKKAVTVDFSIDQGELVYNETTIHNNGTSGNWIPDFGTWGSGKSFFGDWLGSGVSDFWHKVLLVAEIIGIIIIGIPVLILTLWLLKYVFIFLKYLFVSMRYMKNPFKGSNNVGRPSVMKRIIGKSD